MSRRNHKIYGIRPYDISRNKLHSLQIHFLAIPKGPSFHGDIPFQAGDYVRCLLLLIPAHARIQKENPDDHSKVDPVTQTGSEQDSELHDCQMVSVDLFSGDILLTIKNRPSEIHQELEEHIFLL